MPVKTFKFKLPIDNQSSIPIIDVRQGDTGGNLIIPSLTFKGRPFDLSGATSAKYTVLKEDNTVVAGAAASISNYGNGEVNFTLTDQAITFPGIVYCQVEIYTGAVRITSATFAYTVVTDLANEGDPTSSSEYPILTQLIIDVTALETNVETAETSRVIAESGRATAESSRQTSETNRVNAESARATAESSRASAENARATAEGNRVTVESARVTAETNRASAEGSRVTAESGRATAENARVTNESNRVTAETARESERNAFKVWESYSSIKAYEPLNKVSYNGSSYIAVAASTGVTPGTDPAKWLMIAQKGDTGEPGVDWKGDYAPATAYVLNDGVYYNGSSYRALQATTGNAPTNATYWKPIALKGTDGEGAGDMTKVEYDTVGDGVVNAARYAAVAPWAGISDKPLTFAPSAHKTNHATEGTDVLTPVDIGAESKADADAHKAEIASDTELGHVKVDGVTVTIDENGVISSAGEKDTLSPSITIKKLIDQQPVKIVCFGDSMTWGYNNGGAQSANPYPAVLQTKMRYLWGYNDITVVNAGLNGSSVETALPYFNTSVLAEAPDLCVAMFGLNDNATSDVSLADYIADLRTLVGLCKDNSIEVILMAPTATIDRTTANMGNDYNLTMVDYAKACEALAKEQGVDYIDMHSEIIRLWKTNGLKRSFYDGTGHFFDYTIIADILMKERLADKYTSEFKDMEFVSFSSPYIYNDVTAISDSGTTTLVTWYNIDNSIPAESIKFAIYNDTPGATLNFYTLKTAAAGNIMLTNWGADFASIDGIDAVTANDWLESVTLPNVGLYFFELKASKVDAGKIFYATGLYYQKDHLLKTAALTLQNSWANAGGAFQTAKYYRNNKVVYLAGTIASGVVTDGTLIATLPVNARPTADLLLPVASANGATLQIGLLKIAVNGQITCYKNIANTYLSLNGITFVTQ
jgi:lysophospholipase L1-like esterase